MLLYLGLTLRESNCHCFKLGISVNSLLRTRTSRHKLPHRYTMVTSRKVSVTSRRQTVEPHALKAIFTIAPVPFVMNHTQRIRSAGFELQRLH